MKRTLAVVVLAVILMVALVVPAVAVPANNGLGMMFGEHIRTEAHAGTLGPDVHPGMHHGFAGWMH